MSLGQASPVEPGPKSSSAAGVATVGGGSVGFASTTGVAMAATGTGVAVGACAVGAIAVATTASGAAVSAGTSTVGAGATCGAPPSRSRPKPTTAATTRTPAN